jgi:hypothetical protein
MPESASNVELAHRVHESGHEHGAPHGGPAWVGIAEAVLLAVVAVATAWSGFQASKWDAVSAKDYALATSTTALAQERATLAGQDRLYDTVTFNGWVAAKTAGREKLAAFYERRFRPEYAVAFRAWMRLNPLTNASAPAGPIFMPEYANANAKASAKLSHDAVAIFERGVSTRETGDSYVEVTVFLATVLFLTALSQRFEVMGARIAVVVVAFVLLVVSTCWIVVLPRA